MADKGGKMEEVVSDMVIEEEVAAIDVVKGGTRGVEADTASPKLSTVGGESVQWKRRTEGVGCDARANRSPEGADGQCNSHRTQSYSMPEALDPACALLRL
jgi:hypothetical protein